MFRYRDFLRMDVRDFLLWTRQARISHLRKRLEAIQNARVALAQDDDYKDFMQDLKSELYAITNGYEKTVKENWEALRNSARRKR